MSPVKFPNGVYVFQNRCLFSVCMYVLVRVCVCVSVGAENLISTLSFKISSHAINVLFFIKIQNFQECQDGTVGCF